MACWRIVCVNEHFSVQFIKHLWVLRIGIILFFQTKPYLLNLLMVHEKTSELIGQDVHDKIDASSLLGADGYQGGFLLNMLIQ